MLEFGTFIILIGQKVNLHFISQENIFFVVIYISILGFFLYLLPSVNILLLFTIRIINIPMSASERQKAV